jgi:hypothetical protein
MKREERKEKLKFDFIAQEPFNKTLLFRKRVENNYNQ